MTNIYKYELKQLESMAIKQIKNGEYKSSLELSDLFNKEAPVCLSYKRACKIYRQAKDCLQIYKLIHLQNNN